MNTYRKKNRTRISLDVVIFYDRIDNVEKVSIKKEESNEEINLSLKCILRMEDEINFCIFHGLEIIKGNNKRK